MSFMNPVELWVVNCHQYLGLCGRLVTQSVSDQQMFLISVQELFGHGPIVSLTFTPLIATKREVWVCNYVQMAMVTKATEQRQNNNVTGDCDKFTTWRSSAIVPQQRSINFHQRRTIFTNDEQSSLKRQPKRSIWWLNTKKKSSYQFFREYWSCSTPDNVRKTVIGFCADVLSW